MSYVFAIDPGTDQSAYVLWSGCAPRVEECAILPNEELNQLIRTYHWGDAPVSCAIEMVASYGMPVGREVFETVLWIGRFYESWCRRFDCDPLLVYRKDVKVHHCGTAKAKDANIAQALKDRYGKTGTRSQPGPLFGVKSHLWAALAVATYTSETVQFRKAA